MASMWRMDNQDMVMSGMKTNFEAIVFIQVEDFGDLDQIEMMRNGQIRCKFWEEEPKKS